MVTVRVLTLAVLLACMASPLVHCQNQPPSPSGITRTVLASAPLASVVDAPRHFKLVSVRLSANQETAYSGPMGFVFVLDGELDVSGDPTPQNLAKGDALFVAAGKRVSIAAGGKKPAAYLHFLLATAAELGSPLENRPAVIQEVFRSQSPVPGLKAGPYEFTLVRVAFPPRFSANPPHHRSGAALYYINAGTGMITFDGKTEPRPAGAIQYEPHDFVHYWANPGGQALVMIQANLSQEGVPAVVFVQEPNKSPPK